MESYDLQLDILIAREKNIRCHQVWLRLAVFIIYLLKIKKILN